VELPSKVSIVDSPIAVLLTTSKELYQGVHMVPDCYIHSKHICTGHMHSAVTSFPRLRCHIRNRVLCSLTM